MIIVLLVIMFGCLLLGFPMFMCMVLSAMVAILGFLTTMQPTAIIQQLMGGISSFPLLSIPLFIFAADIMSAGHTAKRLVEFVKAFIGHIHGGLGATLSGTCTLFGAISGSSQATVVAIGKTLRPQMLDAGYQESDVDGLIVSSANIAALIPPSVTMIMYSVVTGTSVGEMFIAGIGPGVLLFALFSLYQWFHAKRHNTPREKKTTWSEKGKAFIRALLPLGFPVIIVGSIYSGKASPTEAAAISVLYAAILEIVIYRTVKIKDLGKIALSTGAVTATLFILLASGSDICKCAADDCKRCIRKQSFNDHNITVGNSILLYRRNVCRPTDCRGCSNPDFLWTGHGCRHRPNLVGHYYNNPVHPGSNISSIWM